MCTLEDLLVWAMVDDAANLDLEFGVDMIRQAERKGRDDSTYKLRSPESVSVYLVESGHLLSLG
jgi:hypothetical protein